MNLETKYENLKDIIRSLESVAVAFSGGVDSTFLSKVCRDVLGDNAIAVTATSSTYPEREFKQSIELAKQIGIKQIVIESEETEIEGFSKNPPNRCYYCKYELFSKVREVANDNNIKNVLDGSNFDDLKDYRPGSKAARELNVVSPLKEAKLTKEDIRILSKELNLPTWDKPAFACLSSRFPYGEEITPQKLTMLDKGENYLRDLGFKQFRIRHHGQIARIEVAPDERVKLFDISLLNDISKKLKELGFAYVTMDLEGYRTGSMNEVLSEEEKI
ncbi:ATP-dependent sacrificial sulfur transferase LarE [Alkalithermobacter paradoxus]|uniref:NH(3)-dependent NAD(+) synthetase n=1 Tax=Alkalithermobacter paradoxus TaxID=29349 RepID=A0A1V4I5H1_9FIRM|nr:NH(3)-dependent NAD(+) synthetase [[Clostridium] thermoalcaliphilum]